MPLQINAVERCILITLYNNSTGHLLQERDIPLLAAYLFDHLEHVKSSRKRFLSEEQNTTEPVKHIKLSLEGQEEREEPASQG